jgi:hypothetical protein
LGKSRTHFKKPFGLKKVLIISYFYPPANFVGAQRTAAWAKYLHEYGYYPIIITRQWNEGQIDLVDKVIDNELSIEKNETHEVHRLPHKYSLRDRLSNYPILRPIQKALTLKELIFSNFSLKHLSFSNFYSYSKCLIQEDSQIRIVLASGRPFESFFIGHQLKNDFPGTHWVPDYRDEWNTHQTPKSLSYTHKLMKKTREHCEQKWTSNASFFISVTPNWTKNIASFIEIEGKTVLNGFDTTSPPYLTSKKNNKNTLELSYLGSTYESQDFSILIDSVLDIIEKLEVMFILNFFGSRPTELIKASKLEEKANGKLVFNFFDRMDRTNLLPKVKNTDILFLTSLNNNNGWLPVKIFDYYNSDKPILLCPSDNELMVSFIEETCSGYVANSVTECKTILINLITLKKEGKQLIGPRNKERAKFYSRKHQTQRLAEYLDQLN